MSSLNPVVGVSLCIGALGAGLAYLAWNNQDEDINASNMVNNENVKENDNSSEDKKVNTEVKIETQTEKSTVQENNSEDSSGNQNSELKPNNVSKTPNDYAIDAAVEKQSLMKQFLKESYENSKQN